MHVQLSATRSSIKLVLLLILRCVLTRTDHRSCPRMPWLSAVQRVARTPHEALCGLPQILAGSCCGHSTLNQHVALVALTRINATILGEPLAVRPRHPKNEPALGLKTKCPWPRYAQDKLCCLPTRACLDASPCCHESLSSYAARE